MSSNIPDMGRPKTVFLDLPPRMTARKSKSGSVRYYYNKGGKKISLGSDLNKARMEWVKYENGGVPQSQSSYAAVAERWEREAVNIGRHGKQRSPKTQFEYARCLKNLYPAFKEFQLEEIKPKHIREYLDKRSAKVSANREKAVLSLIFNWARGKGITDVPNPCLGIEGNEERSRERYVTDEEYLSVWEKAVPELQDAMDLAYLTGQRMSDVLKMTRQDIKEGCLWVRQNKTGVRLGIRLEGQLQIVVERILARPRAIPTMLLVSGNDGQKLSINQVWVRFHSALVSSGCPHWQFRDIRAKSATDAGNIAHAQRLLGHSTEATTAAVYRRVKGNVVSPLK